MEFCYMQRSHNITITETSLKENTHYLVHQVGLWRPRIDREDPKSIAAVASHFPREAPNFSPRRHPIPRNSRVAQKFELYAALNSQLKFFWHDTCWDKLTALPRKQQNMKTQNIQSKWITDFSMLLLTSTETIFPFH